MLYKLVFQFVVIPLALNLVHRLGLDDDMKTAVTDNMFGIKSALKK